MRKSSILHLESNEVLVLTLEEAAMLTTDIEADGRSLDEKLVDMGTITEVGKGMNDLAYITHAAQSSTTHALQTIANSMINNVAWSEEAPVLTTESIQETLTNIHQTVVSLLKKIWEQIKGFFDKLFSYRTYLRQRIAKLRKEASKRNEVQITTDAMILLPIREGAVFEIEGKDLINAQAYRNVMKDIIDNVGLNFSHAPSAIDHLGKAFIATVEHFKPDDANATTKDSLVGLIYPALWRYFEAFKISHFKKSTAKDEAMTATAVSPPLAGRCKVQLTWGKAMNEFFVDRDTQKPASDVVHALGQTKVELVERADDTTKGEVKMAALTYGELTSTLNLVEDGLALIDDLERQRDSKLKDVSEQFGKVLQKKADELAKYQADARERDTSTSTREAEATFEALSQLPKVLAKMAVHPVNDIARRTIGTFAVLLNMVEKSIPMYQEKQAA